MKNKKSIYIITLLCITLFQARASEVGESKQQNLLIPAPQEIEELEGVFSLTHDVQILYNSIKLKNEVEILNGILASIFDKPPLVVKKIQNKENKQFGSINLLLNDKTNSNYVTGNEGYELIIEKMQVTITATTTTGVFYGIQTLRQLLLFSLNRQNDTAAVNINCVAIQDKPNYKWRGIMLDPARYFLPIDLLKEYINVMSFYKMNSLHLHLTDNNGWTVEMIKYPELNDQRRWPLISANRNRGMYTRKEVQDLVEYAKKRHITIIPELELPGHNSIVGWIKRDLLCVTNPYRKDDVVFTDSESVENGIGVNTIEWMEPCIGNKKALEVYENILVEFMEIFPSKYIHIGGDEVFGHAWATCPDCQKIIQNDMKKYDTPELQKKFSNCWGDKKKYLGYRYIMTHFSDFITSKGRSPILWDDLSWVSDFPKNVTIMQWHYKGGWDTFQQIKTLEDPAVNAVKSGCKVIVAPYYPLYFIYDSSLKDVYFFDPMPKELSTEHEQENIMGPHACLWDLPIGNIFSKTFPRVYALSQIAWSDNQKKNFHDFENIVEVHKDIITKITSEVK